MAKFSGRIKTPMPRAALATINQRARTFEGGQGWVADPETELFLLAATMMAGEGSFYLPAEVRDARFVELVHRVTATNPAFVAGLAAYLRNELKIRSASIMLAAEYVAAGGGGGRAVVDSVLQRGDEPAEMVAYWLGRYGRSMKMAVKRGVADAVQRLYTERAALRYDGQSRAVRMADVIELSHPRHAISGRLLCIAGCSTAVTTVTPRPTPTCCRCWLPPRRSRRCRPTSVVTTCASRVPRRSPVRASAGSVCRAGCPAA